MDKLVLTNVLRDYGSFDVYFKKFGFLEGLNGEIKETCCNSLTCMAEYLLENDPPSDTAIGVNMRFMMFPIIRLVVSRTKKPLVDAGAFYDFCKSYIDEHADHFLKVVEVSAHYVDLECMVSREIADTVVKILNQEEDEAL